MEDVAPLPQVAYSAGNTAPVSQLFFTITCTERTVNDLVHRARQRKAARNALARLKGTSIFHGELAGSNEEQQRLRAQLRQVRQETKPDGVLFFDSEVLADLNLDSSALQEVRG